MLTDSFSPHLSAELGTAGDTEDVGFWASALKELRIQLQRRGYSKQKKQKIKATIMMSLEQHQNPPEGCGSRVLAHPRAPDTACPRRAPRMLLTYSHILPTLLAQSPRSENPWDSRVSLREGRPGLAGIWGNSSAFSTASLM